MDTLLTEELWNTLAPLLPHHPPSPKGGRRRLPDRLCLGGVLFVLREGIRWQSLPRQRGWGSGTTCWRLHGVDPGGCLGEGACSSGHRLGGTRSAESGSRRGG